MPKRRRRGASDDDDDDDSDPSFVDMNVSPTQTPSKRRTRGRKRQRMVDASDSSSAEALSVPAPTKDAAVVAAASASSTETAAQVDALLDAQEARLAADLPSPLDADYPLSLDERMALVEDYTIGAVVRIKVSNWKSYGEVELFPGARLNLLIGPTGTGKSSIVDAMVVGLGGQWKLLNNAKHLHEYILKGKQKTRIECELFNPDGPNWVVTREIRIKRTGARVSETSTFRINNRKVTTSDVEDLVVRRLNIQFSNLCQFLPQFRVREFSLLTREELLKETEKAVSTTHLYDVHMQLSKMRERQRDIERDKDSAEAQYAEMLRKKERLHAQAARVRERAELQKQMVVLRKKEPWVMRDVAMVQYKAAKAETMKHTVAYREAAQALVPLAECAKTLGKLGESRGKKVAALSKVGERVHREQVAAVEAVKDSSQDMETAVMNLTHLDERMQEYVHELKSIEADIRQRRFFLAKHVSDILISANEPNVPVGDALNNLTDAQLADLRKRGESHIQQSMARLVDARRTLQAKSREASGVQTHHERDLHATRARKRKLQASIEQVVTPEKHRLAYLERALGQQRNNTRPLQAIRAAHGFVERHAGMFSGKVYGPMCIHVGVKDPRMCHAVNQVIGWRYSRSFLFPTTQDERRFAGEYQKIVNADRVPTMAMTSTAPQHPVSVDDLKAYGLDGYLVDLLDAPEPVLWALHARVGLYNVAVGPDDVVNSEHIYELLRRSRGRLVIVSTRRVVRAGNRRAFSTGPLSVNNREFPTRGAPLYTAEDVGSGNAARNAEIQSEIATIDAHLAEIGVAVKDAQARVTAINSKLEKVRDSAKNTRNLREVLVKSSTKLEKQIAARDAFEIPDEQSQRRAISERIRRLHQRRMTSLAEAVSKVGILHSASLQLDEAKILQAHTTQHKVMVETELDTRKQEHASLREAAEKAKASYLRLKKESKRLHQLALANTGALYDSQGTPLQAELIAAFETLPDDLQELRQMIHEHRQRLTNIEASDDALRQYEAAEKAVQELEHTLNGHVSELTMITQQIDKIAAPWKRRIQRLASILNTAVGRYFASFGCVGQVTLVDHRTNVDDPFTERDYARYQLEIAVSFRPGETPTPLDGLRQSGGEKSLTTMLFLVALQDLGRGGLSAGPFRLVDEINQGLDPQNERKVFERIAAVSCTQDSQQNFYVSPKLLRDLPLQPECRVLCVFNGPRMAWGREMDEDRMIQTLSQAVPVPPALSS